MKENKNAVEHPSHYSEGRLYEPIDVINDWELDFDLGNALKYISRAGRKDRSKEIEDLEKAIFYINDRIKRIKELNSEESVNKLELYYNNDKEELYYDNKFN